MNPNDLSNAVRNLNKALKSINFDYNESFSQNIKSGSFTEFLKIYHYLFLNYSASIAAEILNNYNETLASKTDKQFMDTIYKLCRVMLNYTPKINQTQFFHNGFTVVKCIMCTEIIELIKVKSKSLQPTTSNVVATSSSYVSNKPGSSAKLSNTAIISKLKETPLPIESLDEKVISPKIGNLKNSQIAKSLKSSLFQNHTKNQPLIKSSIKKSYSVRENTYYRKIEEQENQKYEQVNTNGDVATKTAVETMLTNINQTLFDINAKLATFENRLIIIEEQMGQNSKLTRNSTSTASSVSSISVESDNSNGDHLTKLQKKMENLVARFDLLENENILIKQNQKNINNMISNTNFNNNGSNRNSYERGDDTETTINDYETPGNSFLNISGSHNYLFNDLNENSNQLFSNSTNKTGPKKSIALVQGTISPRQENVSLHSNDTTPTMQKNHSPISAKSSNMNEPGKDMSDALVQTKQLIMRATHLNEAYSQNHRPI